MSENSSGALGSALVGAMASLGTSAMSISSNRRAMNRQYKYQKKLNQ